MLTNSSSVSASSHPFHLTTYPKPQQPHEQTHHIHIQIHATMCHHVIHKDVMVRYDWTPPEAKYSEAGIKCGHMVALKQTEVWSLGPDFCECTEEVDHHLPPGSNPQNEPKTLNERAEPGSGIDTLLAAVSNMQIPCPACRLEEWARDSFKGKLLHVR